MSQCAPPKLKECYWTRIIWSSVPVGLLITGTVGNIINIVVLSRRSMRKFSTSVYLLCLACSDLTFLWTGMGPRMLLHGYDLDIKAKSAFVCKVVTWLQASAAGYSIWILVLLTLERVFLTKSPVLARVILSRTKTLIAALTTLVLCLLLTLHGLFGYDSVTFIAFDRGSNTSYSKSMCTVANTDFASFYKRTWPLIVLVVLSIIPMAVILIGNIAIALTIIVQRRKMRRVNTGANTEQNAGPAKVKSATKLLLLVSTMFMSTTLPFTFGNVILASRKPSTVQQAALKHLIYSVLRNLLYCNFTFNFVLYFASGTLFKQEWEALVEDMRVAFRKLHGRGTRVAEHTGTATCSSQPSNNPVTQDTY